MSEAERSVPLPCGYGPGDNKVTSVVVIDGTHMDLLDLNFVGTYTSGGSITSLPP